MTNLTDKVQLLIEENCLLTNRLALIEESLEKIQKDQNKMSASNKTKSDMVDEKFKDIYEQTKEIEKYGQKLMNMNETLDSILSILQGNTSPLTHNITTCFNQPIFTYTDEMKSFNGAKIPGGDHLGPCTLVSEIGTVNYKPGTEYERKQNNIWQQLLKNDPVYIESAPILLPLEGGTLCIGIDFHNNSLHSLKVHCFAFSGFEWNKNHQYLLPQKIKISFSFRNSDGSFNYPHICQFYLTAFKEEFCDIINLDTNLSHERFPLIRLCVLK